MNRSIASVFALWSIALVGVVLVFFSGFNFFGLLNVQALNGPLPPDLAGLAYRAFVDACASGILTLAAAIILLRTRTLRLMIIGLVVLVVGLLLLYDGGNYWHRFDLEFNSLNSDTPTFPLWAAVLILECVLLAIAYLSIARRTAGPADSALGKATVDTHEADSASSVSMATTPVELVRRVRIALAAIIYVGCAVLNFVVVNYLHEAQSDVADTVSEYTRQNGNNIELQIVHFQFTVVGDSALLAGLFFAFGAVAVSLGYRWRFGGVAFMSSSLLAICADGLANYTKPELPVPAAFAGFFWFLVVAALSSPLWRRGLWPLPNLLLSLGGPLAVGIIALIGIGAGSHSLYQRLQIAQNRPASCSAGSLLVSQAEDAYDNEQQTDLVSIKRLLPDCVTWAKSTGDTDTITSWTDAQQSIDQISARPETCSANRLRQMAAEATLSTLSTVRSTVAQCEEQALSTTDAHAKRLRDILTQLSDQTAAPELAASSDYDLFVPSRNTQCRVTNDFTGDAASPDTFDSSIFAGVKVAEQRDPTPNSDDAGDALYVVFDPAHMIAAAKITASPKSSQSYQFFVIQRVERAPIQVSLQADLSSAGMKSGIRLGSTTAELVRAYGQKSKYNLCSNTVTYAFSRWTKPHVDGDVGDPKRTVEFTLTGQSGVVNRIVFSP